jgi:hypothetical protein
MLLFLDELLRNNPADRKLVHTPPLSEAVARSDCTNQVDHGGAGEQLNEVPRLHNLVGGIAGERSLATNVGQRHDWIHRALWTRRSGD